jgi:murein DD-endopeptidase MepM/ murein hydrolase activator NlpD
MRNYLIMILMLLSGFLAIVKIDIQSNAIYEETLLKKVDINNEILEMRGAYLRKKYEELPLRSYTDDGVPMLKKPLTEYIETQPYGKTKWIKAYGGMGLSGHIGIDWKATSGSPVYAAHDGIVFEAYGNHSNAVEGKIGYGNRIKLRAREGQKGYETVYAHLNEVFVSVGDKIRAGQKIGTVGDTGFSSAPHLHFGIRFLWFCNDSGVETPCEVIDGDNGMMGWVDPVKYLID